MKNRRLIAPTDLKGLSVIAEYIESPLEDYKGNPLIEALPPILNEFEVANKIRCLPRFNEAERELDSSLRLHCVQRLDGFVEPLPLHLEIEQVLSRMLRYGYVARNPLNEGYTKLLRQKNVLDTQEIRVIKSTASSFALIGISGIGKSTTIDNLLLMYPQVVAHSNYQGQNLTLYQLVWLKLECPFDGSLKSLCLNFFAAVDNRLGSNHYRENSSRNKSVEQMIPIMAKVAAQCCLGVLVIDEIQHLSEAKSGGSDKMLNFFVKLVNTIGLPVIMIGTYKAADLFISQFRNARRGTGQGSKIIHRLENGEEWRLFIEGMWKYQWVKDPVPLSDELVDAIYDRSQGVLDLAVKLFMLSQWRAIADRTETITKGLINKVANDSFQLVETVLNALRERNYSLLKQFDDVCLTDEEMLNHFRESLSKTEKKKHLKSLKEQQQLLKLQEENSRVAYISSWLVQGGCEPKKAQSIAEKVVMNCGDKNLQELCQEAIRVMLVKHDTERTKEIKPKTRTKKQDKTGLLQIVKTGLENKTPPYEALKEAGIIKNIGELKIL